MFDNISETYDLLNLVLSFRMDYMWRKKSIENIKNNPEKILDIATGTADFAIMAAKYTNAKIIGVDISKKMLIGTAIIIFVFRAIPGVGQGGSWFEIDVLEFNEQFFSVLSLLASVLTLAGIVLLRPFMAKNSIAKIFFGLI